MSIEMLNKGHERVATPVDQHRIGVFDDVRADPKHAIETTDRVVVHREQGHRLLRAPGGLGSIGHPGRRERQR